MQTCFDPKEQWRVSVWVVAGLGKGLFDAWADAAIYGRFPVLSPEASTGLGLALDTTEVPSRLVVTMPLAMEWLAKQPWKRLVLADEGLFLIGLSASGRPFGFGMVVDAATRAVFERSCSIAELGIMKPVMAADGRPRWSWKKSRVLSFRNASSAPLLQAVDEINHGR